MQKGLNRASFFENRYLYLMLIPGLIYFIVYRYIPMFGLAIAFKKYYPARGFLDSKWVGLYYFNKILRSPEIIRVMVNTLLISSYKIIFAFPVPIILAIMINEIRTMALKKTVQTISYLPHFLSWVVFGEIIKVFLSADGAVNSLLGIFGAEPTYFMINADLFRGITVVTAILKNSGWGTIVYLASISTIDPQLYEAAFMDGANRLRRIWHITLPSIKGVITVMLILRVGYILDAGFEQIFVLYNEAVYRTGDIFGTYVYRVGLSQGEYSLATAVGLYKGLVGFLMIWGANRISKSIGEEGVW
jgi:putative aldouronate transport system permease protein